MDVEIQVQCAAVIVAPPSAIVKTELLGSDLGFTVVTCTWISPIDLFIVGSLARAPGHSLKVDERELLAV
jgi:hypothetical protein